MEKGGDKREDGKGRRGGGRRDEGGGRSRPPSFCPLSSLLPHLSSLLPPPLLPPAPSCLFFSPSSL
jgi:hypothetical protein